MSYSLKIPLGILFGLTLCLGVFSVYAQSVQDIQDISRVGNDDVDVIVTPEVPGAFEDVTMKVQSYLTDVNRAFIIWKKDGKTLLSGTGKIDFSFTTNDVGRETVIDVEMLLIGGESVKKHFSFNPAEVNLVWEGADSYTPPFYRGRALPTSEGVMRVLAIPQMKIGSNITSTSNYVFTWKRNDKVIQRGSGYEKNAFLFRQDYLNDEEHIEVTSQDNTSGAIAKGDVIMKTYTPKIVFYERDPIYGIDWAHALEGEFDVASAEKTIIAIPYFFSPADPLANDFSYTWSINGKEIDTPAIKNMLTLKSSGQQGVSNITLKIENALKLFLDATGSITVNLK